MNACWAAAVAGLSAALLALAVLFRKLLAQVRFHADESASVSEQLLREVQAHRQSQLMLRVQRDLFMAARPTVSESLDWMLEVLVQIPGVDSGGVYLAPEEGGLQLVAHRGLSRAFVESQGKIAPESPLNRLVLAGWAVTHNYQDLMRDRDVHAVDSEGLRALAVLPIKYKTRILGALNMASHTAEAFPPGTVATLEAAAMQIGGIISSVRAEERERHSRTNLEILFHTLADLVFIVGAEGRIRHANQTLCRTLGYCEHELTAMNLSDLYPQEFTDEVKALWLAPVADQGIICLVPLRSRSGNWLAVETKVTCGEWNGETVKIGISREFSNYRFLSREGAPKGVG